MGFIAPAMPWIIKGASMLGGYFGAKKGQSAAMKRSPEESTALTGAQGAAGDLTRTGTGQLRAGTSLIQSGQEAVNPATSYYQSLLRGNRAAQTQAVAAPRAAISDVYGGAEKSLERSGVRGAQKDVASGEIARERAGKISSLITGVQPGAAAALTQTGLSQIGQGAGLTQAASSSYGQAGSTFANLLGQGQYNRQYGRAEGEKTGAGIGGFLFDVLSGTMKKKKPAFAGGISPGDFGSDEWMHS